MLKALKSEEMQSCRTDENEVATNYGLNDKQHLSIESRGKNDGSEQNATGDRQYCGQSHSERSLLFESTALSSRVLHTSDRVPRRLR